MTNAIPFLWEDVIPFYILKQFKSPYTEDISLFQLLFLFSGEKLNPIKNAKRNQFGIWSNATEFQSKYILLTYAALQGQPTLIGL